MTETIEMRNRPDHIGFFLDLIFPAILSAIVLAAYLLHIEWLAWIFLALVIVTFNLLVWSEYFDRPVAVEIGDEITFRSRLGKEFIASYGQIKTLVVYPEGLRTARTGGVVRFDGRRTAIGLNLEIMVMIDQKYFEKMGKRPPLPEWYAQRHKH